MACLVFDHEQPLSVHATGTLAADSDSEACTFVLTYSGNRIAQINIANTCADFASSSIVGDRGVITVSSYSKSQKRM